MKVKNMHIILLGLLSKFDSLAIYIISPMPTRFSRRTYQHGIDVMTEVFHPGHMAHIFPPASGMSSMWFTLLYNMTINRGLISSICPQSKINTSHIGITLIHVINLRLPIVEGNGIEVVKILSGS